MLFLNIASEVIFSCPACRQPLDSKIFRRITQEDFNLGTRLCRQIEFNNYLALKEWLSKPTESTPEPLKDYPYTRYSVMLKAAACGDIISLIILNNRGAPWDRFNKKRGFTTTPLSAAVANGHISATRLLLNRGACPNATAESRPLITAMYFANEEIVNLLVSKNVDFTLTNSNEQTPLMTLLLGRRDRYKQEQEEAKARSRCDRLTRYFRPNKPCDNSEDEREARLVRMCLDHNVDLSTTFEHHTESRERISVVNLAAAVASADAFAQIVDKAPSEILHLPNINPTSHTRQDLATAISIISSRLRLPAFDALERNGVDHFKTVLNRCPPESIVRTPLSTREPLLTVLVKKTIDPNIPSSTKEQKEYFNKVSITLEKGFFPSPTDYQGLTPLHHVVRMPINTQRQIDLIQLLKQRGALVNSQDANKRLPVHLYAQSQPGSNYSQEILEALIKPQLLTATSAQIIHPKSQEALRVGQNDVKQMIREREPTISEEELHPSAFPISSYEARQLTQEYSPFRDGKINSMQMIILVNNQDINGDTPLHHAIRFYYNGGKNRKTIQDLISLKANYNVANYAGETPKSICMTHPKDNILKTIYSKPLLVDVCRDHSTEFISHDTTKTPYYMFKTDDPDLKPSNYCTIL